MKTNFFKKLFYPPQYLSIRAAGISIDNQYVRYIEFANIKRNFSIKNFGTVPLPQNTVKDGEIINKSALAKALSEVKTKISSDFVKISIPEEKTYIFDTEILLVKGSNIRESIEFKLEENVPLKIDEVSFEYDIIKEEKNNIHNMFVSVSVIPKKTIENFTEVCTLAGLVPTGFEIESRMMAQSVVPKEDKRTFLIIDIKDGSTLLALVISGIVRFTSTIAVDSGAAKENILSAIKDEIGEFDKYLLSKSEGKGILLPKAVDEIILSGRSAALPDFASSLSKNINVKVTIANVWENIFDINDRLPRLTFEDSLDFTTAIGLAIS